MIQKIARKGLIFRRPKFLENYVQKPNIKKRSLYSHTLKEFFHLPVSHGALRDIEKLGGLDPFLLIKDVRESDVGTEIKRRIQQKLRDEQKEEIRSEQQTGKSSRKQEAEEIHSEKGTALSSVFYKISFYSRKLLFAARRLNPIK